MIEKIKKLIIEEKKNKLIIGADHHFDHWDGLTDDNYRLENKSLKLLT